MKFYLLILLIFLVNISSVRADMCSLAERLDKRNRNLTADSIYNACANIKGNSEYKYAYAKRLYDGIYAQKNNYRAIYFFRAAAADNHQEAMLKLGDMALKGENKYSYDTNRKPVSAMIWYSIAAYYGNENAKAKQKRLEKQIDKNVIENEVVPMVGAWVQHADKRRRLSKEIP